jgi:hypothetical protein
VVTVPYGMSLSRMALWLTAAVRAVSAATESLLAHQGRPAHKLNQTVLPILAGWRTAYPRIDDE